MKTVNTGHPPARVASIVRKDLTWIDITDPARKEFDYLSQTYSFHHLAVEDSLSHTQLTKVDDYQTYLFAMAHLPVLTEKDQVVKSTWLSVFIGENYVITLHDSTLKGLTDLFRECQADEAERNTYCSRGPGYLSYRIIAFLVNNSFPILDKLLARMEDIEDNVFDETASDTRDIFSLRRDIIALRRIISPFRTFIPDLKTGIRRLAGTDLEVYFDNLLDQVNKIWNNLEEAKEVVEVYKDTDVVLVTSRINRIVQILTIVSVILLPFLIISSLYGMNINLPGGLAAGNLTTFGVLLGIMLLISGGMLYWMHRRHWI